ncbi:MAG: amidohydrolase family protein [Gemmatimonadaceae bacterium]|nr:amidohydrolase family protein [Gemmatimonadaceae bacterium]
MPRRLLRLRALLAVALCTVVAVGATRPSRAGVTALVGGTLIDGHGGTPLRNSVVLIEGGRISAVGSVGTLAVPRGATVISTEGMRVLPGLWDMHVHLMLAGHSNYAHWDRTYPNELERTIIPATARQSLRAGVTSVRDLGAPLDAIMNVKRRIDRGELPGPTIYASGPFLQHAPYPGTELFRWGINGVEDARAKVRRLADAGVSEIKLIDQDEMTMEEVRAITDEAHKRKLPVVAHAHRPEEIRRGLAADVDDFEHTGLATAAEYPADIVAGLRERAAEGNRAPLFWTPTIDVLTHYTERRDAPEYIDDPRWTEGLPDSIARDIRRSLERMDTLTYYRFVPNRRPTLARKFQQLRESGVRLLIGTDAGVPGNFHGYATPEEMVTWVRDYGMSAMETIRAATYWPALAMGVLDQVGTVSVGKTADIIAVRGDPLRDIESLRRIDLVLARGVRVR